MKGFVEFIREQGVMGLAVGFILGGAVSRMVASLVNDIINPILGLMLGSVGDLSRMYLVLGPAKLMWGSFLSTAINFAVIAAVVYSSVKLLRLDQLDKKK